MNKLFAFFLIIPLFMGCSKDDSNTDEFPAGVPEVLEVLNGIFTGEEYSLGQLYRTDKMTFSPLAVPTEKTTWQGTISMYGTIHRVQNKSVGGEVIDDYYFHIDPSLKQLILYGYNIENNDFDATQERYEYNIQSSTSIQLKKYGMSGDNWITYTK